MDKTPRPGFMMVRSGVQSCESRDEAQTASAASSNEAGPSMIQSFTWSSAPVLASSTVPQSMAREISPALGGREERTLEGGKVVQQRARGEEIECVRHQTSARTGEEGAGSGGGEKKRKWEEELDMSGEGEEMIKRVRSRG